MPGTRFGRGRAAPALSFFLVAAILVPTALPALEFGTRASTMPDLSGLAWLEGDLFLAVHDAKTPEEADLPRASLLELPAGLDGIRWQPLELAFPGEVSNDFESVARIPNTPFVLLVESTEEQEEKPFSRRIFLAEFAEMRLAIRETVEWPVPTSNVEATAVAAVAGRLLFLFAERNGGSPNTEIRWAEMELDPVRFGPFRGVTFTSPGPVGPGARPVSAMDVDSRGNIYVASAFDPGDDNGPFRSCVYRAGVVRVPGEADSGKVVLLKERARRVAELDGLKVESVALRQLPAAPAELFVGMDDENYGGTLRPVSLEE